MYKPLSEINGIFYRCEHFFARVVARISPIKIPLGKPSFISGKAYLPIRKAFELNVSERLRHLIELMVNAYEMYG